MNMLCFFLFFLFLMMSSTMTYNEYKKLDVIYVLDNVIEVFLTEEDLKQIQKNNYLYLNSKKQKVKFLSITKNVYQRKKLSYHQVLLEISNINKNTTLNISIFREKKKWITLLKDSWKEET